jgi:hypothetical protein
MSQLASEQNNPQYAFSRKLGRPFGHSGHFGEDEIACTWPKSKPDFSVVNPVPWLTVLTASVQFNHLEHMLILCLMAY